MRRIATYLAIVVVVVSAGCAGTTPSPTPAPSGGDVATARPSPSTQVSPTSSPAPRSTPTAQPSATPRATPTPLAWTRLGAIQTGREGSVRGMTRLGDGYVAWGDYWPKGDDPLFATWYSTDGRRWERTVHATMIVPCPGWVARSDLDTVSAPATRNGALVFTSTQLIANGPGCDRDVERGALISLASTDGRTWKRSQWFGPAFDDFRWSEATWAVPGGWETLVEGESNDATPDEDDMLVTTWRSSDLESWTQVAQRAVSDVGVFHVVGVSDDGTRLAVATDDGEPTQLLASDDGASWEVVRTLPADFWVGTVTPPASADRPWLVTMWRHEQETARALVSSDLVTWDRATLPKPAFREVFATSAGWIGIGYWPLRETGCRDSCRTEDPSLYTSRDGLTWTEHPGALPPGVSLGDGGVLLGDVGAGEVLAVAAPNRKGNAVVRRLVGGQ